MQHDMFTKKLTAAQAEMLGRITHALNNMGCKFLVITPDGEKFGNMPDKLEVIERKKRRMKHPYGTVTNYIRPLMENAKVGEVVEIPFHEFITPADLLASASSLACRLWGNGTHTSCINNDTKKIEVLRTGGI